MMPFTPYSFCIQINSINSQSAYATCPTFSTGFTASCRKQAT